MSKEERETPIHGDVLEKIISHVPTLHLLPASHVSKSWRRAVSSSLTCRLKPWLILHLTCRRSRNNHHSSSTHAYDPHSRAWIQIPHVPSTPLLTCPLRSSTPRLLFSLSLSKLSISSDPFAAAWLNLDPPRVCRVDPVVALVGSSIVVAGGTCDFEDDARAVEIYDLDTNSWRSCDPIPEILRESSSSTWLSSASSDRNLYLMEKRSGTIISLDPETGIWSRTCEILPDPDIFISTVDYSDGRLILAGVAGQGGNVERITIWEVVDDDHVTLGFKEIGKVPKEMVERMACNGSEISGICLSVEGDIGYLYNRSGMGEECFVWEIGEEGRWESIGRPKAVDDNPMARIVFGGCSTVGIDDLKKVYHRSDV